MVCPRACFADTRKKVKQGGQDEFLLKAPDEFWKTKHVEIWLESMVGPPPTSWPCRHPFGVSTGRSGGAVRRGQELRLLESCDRDMCRLPQSVRKTYLARDATSQEIMGRERRRPRSTPAGLRARAEAASTVLDRRPPWSLPLDSVFAPRVKGTAQVGGVSTKELSDCPPNLGMTTGKTPLGNLRSTLWRTLSPMLGCNTPHATE